MSEIELKMSATVERSNVSWRKRRHQGDQSGEFQIKMKKPRYYYYRLASESSKGSEEDTESVYSIQDHETDVARDTTDTDSKSDDQEDIELIEYEVASLSGSSLCLETSASDTDDQVIFAAAIGAMCDSSVEKWITDGEESDSSSLENTSISRLGFMTCVQCKSINDNPLYRYCEKCFQMSCTVPAAPAPPALKDLPKVADDLKTQLEGFKPSNLKNADTQEKVVLPSAEDVAAEKTEKALIEGIERFDTSKLKHTLTQEKNPLPDKEAVQQEKTHQTLLNGVEHFDKTTMKHTETEEKVVLPDKEVIEQEKGQQNLISGIENFDNSKLRHAETLEKNPLPTKEIIDQEKSA